MNMNKEVLRKRLMHQKSQLEELEISIDNIKKECDEIIDCIMTGLDFPIDNSWADGILDWEPQFLCEIDVLPTNGRTTKKTTRKRRKKH